MADIDFSHAVLQPLQKPMNKLNNLGLTANNCYIFMDYGLGYESNPTRTVLINTPTKISILFTGGIGSNGTSFYIGNATNDFIFQVTNISFSAGDSFSFVIDIETSGS